MRGKTLGSGQATEAHGAAPRMTASASPLHRLERRIDDIADLRARLRQETDAHAASRAKLEAQIASLQRSLEASVARAAGLDRDLDQQKDALRTQTDERGALQARLDWLMQRYRREAGLTRLLAGAMARLQDTPGFIGLALTLPQALRLVDWRPRQALRLLRHIDIVRRSGEFDARFYRDRNWDVAVTRVNPLVHYTLQGWRDGRDPSAAFSTQGYLSRYPDVASAHICPLVHYQLWGRAQGRASRDRGAPALKPTSATPAMADRADAHVTRAPATETPVVATSAGGAAGGAAGFTAPPRAPTPSDPYEIRPDDAVAHEAAIGAAFFSRYRLDGPHPDFAGAVAAINAEPPTIRLAGPDDVPDATIIVPVYKELGYTLNCLHALLRHHSRYVAEIIVMDDNSPDESGLLLPRIEGVRVERNAQNLGFLRNCNRGADLARGRYIVHLNNDTRVVDGWLDELLGHFEVYPDTGLVGSKLFFADATLQEAGGIIWQDGSAWNYGRHDDPNRPEYCYARPVDYCSAASIAVPRDLWRQLGGFDELYAPAYCEDSDLAMRVRHQARRGVWFQPLSRAIHYEGVSSGRDLTQGVKAYQVTNSRKFFERWRDTLAGHRANADSPHLERDRGVAKRALVVEPTTPTPDQDAGSNTVVNTCRVLQLMGYRVTFAPEDNMLYQPRYTRPLQRMGVECLYAPFDWKLEDHLQRHGGLYDFILIFRPDCAYRHIDAIRRHAPQAPLAYNNMDLHFLRMERQASTSGDPNLLTAAGDMRNREISVMNKVDCTITPSTEEARIIGEICPGAPVIVAPYLSPLVRQDAPFEARREILFVGGFRHMPNVDAVEWFVSEIFPLVRRRLGDAVVFRVVGAHPPTHFARLAGPQVDITGYVPDVSPYFEMCRVFVAPLRYGAGVKGKVAAAFAHGAPSVLTPVAAEGMDLTAGREAAIAEDPQAFADAVCRLFEDRALWTTMRQAATRYAEDVFSIEGRGVEVMTEVVHISRRHRALDRT
jgi:GT2 family glycosyltransferase